MVELGLVEKVVGSGGGIFKMYEEYSIEEYWKIAELDPGHKYEYVDGHIRMMTGGSPAHGQIALQIGSLLNAALHESKCNVYGSDVAVQITEKRCYFPDVSVSCNPADWTQTKALEYPTLVVEVLSPGTERIDRIEKLQAYQRLAVIQEIIYIDSRKRYVEHYHRIGAYDWKLSIYTHNDDVLELSNIDVRFTVHDIYFKVHLIDDER